jgi:hypothetical protein
MGNKKTFKYSVTIDGKTVYMTNNRKAAKKFFSRMASKYGGKVYFHEHKKGVVSQRQPYKPLGRIASSSSASTEAWTPDGLPRPLP